MCVVNMVGVGMMNEAVGTKAKAEGVASTDIFKDLIHVLFPFPIFIETLRTMFCSSVGEELYCFPFVTF